jgi:hypothetical protein
MVKDLSEHAGERWLKGARRTCAGAFLNVRVPAAALLCLTLLAGCTPPRVTGLPASPSSDPLAAALPAFSTPAARLPTPTGVSATDTPTRTPPSPTPALSPTPIPVSDWVRVDWEALDGLPAADYVLYESAGDLHALSTDGKTDRTLVHGRLAGALRYAAGQPAGDRITLTAPSEGAAALDLHRRELSSVSPPRLESSVFSCAPQGSVSPNQRWALFACGPSGQPFLAVKDLQSGQVLTAPNTPGEGRPEDYLSFSWSPDSRWIVYTRSTTRRFPGKSGAAELMLIDAACLDRSFDTCPLQKSGPFAMKELMIVGSPLVTWSPDSQYIALTSGESGFPLLAFNVYTRGFTAIEAADGAHTASGMAWSVDRNWIAFSEGGQVKLISIHGGRVTTLLHGTSAADVRVAGWLSTFPGPVFQVGSILFITGAGHELRLRETPGLQGVLVDVVSAGLYVRIVAGPLDVDGYRWWKLKDDEHNVSGWAIENPDWYAMRGSKK